MELYERVLCEAIAKDVIPGLQLDYAELLELNAIRRSGKYMRSFPMTGRMIPNALIGLSRSFPLWMIWG